MRKLTIEDMQKIAKRRGGLCLSNQYLNTSTKLKWQCREGHIWEATNDSIQQGHWCPKCSFKKIGDSRRLTIEEMQAIAEQRGGKCLSEKYINTDTKLTWQCKEGHSWDGTYSITCGIDRGLF